MSTDVLIQSYKRISEMDRDIGGSCHYPGATCHAIILARMSGNNGGNSSVGSANETPVGGGSEADDASYGVDDALSHSPIVIIENIKRCRRCYI